MWVVDGASAPLPLSTPCPCDLIHLPPATAALEAYFHLVARDPGIVANLRAHHVAHRLPVPRGGHGATAQAAALELSATAVTSARGRER